ncbi:hypothetical protein [Tumebacillus permanentifrigoris]|uniref:Uncharacterized protein n=1 Tax=Tumebacillus permanentifrigoris TaxID=378543 RepID=A0A316D4L6_9BACL|nr:hypothetical protein [Tumebacillus permanentifrigoris]PWK06643.1 hypothetical protein C7459_11967 [Tumebacillus permanentifrigoris]
MSKGMLIALCLSIVLALSLSWLPDQALTRWGSIRVLDHSAAKQAVPVMKMDGVVHELDALDLSGRMQKVVWEQDKLTVWMSVPSSTVTGEIPWQDSYRIASRFLTGMQMYQAVDVKIVTNDKPDVVRFTVHANSDEMQQAPQPGTAEFEAFVKDKRMQK